MTCQDRQHCNTVLNQVSWILTIVKSPRQELGAVLNGKNKTEKKKKEREQSLP